MPELSIEIIASELASPRMASEDLQKYLMCLKSRYDEPWRYYHRFDHPLRMFKDLLKYKHTVGDPRVIGWAILHHDEVYDPMASPGRNEELSARLAEQTSSEVLPAVDVLKVAAYVRASASHAAETADPDLAFFLDIDLAILGATTGEYDEYARGIRQEYAHVPEEQYKLGRTAVLGELASRVDGDHVFATDVFRETIEEQAQRNLAREIDQLNN